MFRPILLRPTQCHLTLSAPDRNDLAVSPIASGDLLDAGNFSTLEPIRPPQPLDDRIVFTRLMAVAENAGRLELAEECRRRDGGGWAAIAGSVVQSRGNF